MPMLRLWAGTSEMSWPASEIVPRSANSNPAAMRSAVVLPHPDGPSSEISSPWWTSRSRLWSATLLPDALWIESNVRLLMSPFPASREGRVGENLLDDDAARRALRLRACQQSEHPEQERGHHQRLQRERHATLRVAAEVL